MHSGAGKYLVYETMTHKTVKIHDTHHKDFLESVFRLK